MNWVFLSPHFDDVVLSCGGMVWELARAGHQVAVWTICAGLPAPDEPLSAFAQQIHVRWGVGLEAVPARRAEDQAALSKLGAEAHYWDLPDCIYRRLPGDPPAWLVNGEEDLWQPLHPLEAPIVERMALWIAAGIQNLGRGEVVNLVSPLTLGNHVDHALVRAAAERAAVSAHGSLWYYADYPYAAQPGMVAAGKVGPAWQQVSQQVSSDALVAWQDAVACYVSQLSTFWSGREEMNAALESYWRLGGGCYLWQPGQA